MPTTNAGALPSGIPSYDPTAAPAPKASTGMGTSAAETQDYFMKMLLAQIQNQDPMNAQDPAQMTSQLTQLNMASGIEKLNTSLSSMLSQMSAQSFMGNAALIGSSVIAPGSSLTLGASNSVDFGVNVGADSAQTTVKVLAADGTVVDELSLGAMSKGTHRFTWDGAGYNGQRAASGQYRLQVIAADGAGAAVAANTLTSGVVSGVGRDSSGGVQMLTTDGRSVAPADLIQLSKS
jgi:flagellar basal-body rod modification protein FlgD